MSLLTFPERVRKSARNNAQARLENILGQVVEEASELLEKLRAGGNVYASDVRAIAFRAVAGTEYAKVAEVLRAVEDAEDADKQAQEQEKLSLRDLRRLEDALDAQPENIPWLARQLRDAHVAMDGGDQLRDHLKESHGLDPASSTISHCRSLHIARHPKIAGQPHPIRRTP